MTVDFSRLRSLSARRVASALAADGFVLRRQRGSHRHYVHPDGRRVTLSFHHSADAFPMGTLRSIIEVQARWGEEDLRRLRLLANVGWVAKKDWQCQRPVALSTAKGPGICFQRNTEMPRPDNSGQAPLSMTLLRVSRRPRGSRREKTKGAPKRAPVGWISEKSEVEFRS
jgi:predicted RNA binding protein YcfA (HicA-like mRNA interferase family)